MIICTLTHSILMIPAILHQQTTRTVAASVHAGVGGAECGVHYFEFAEK